MISGDAEGVFMGGMFNRKKIFWIVVCMICITQIISIFPIIRFNDKLIPMFAVERLESINLDIIKPRKYFTGIVLGNHVLETEHGEIILKKFTRISAVNNSVGRIDVENFENGLVSHNLVIEGIKMPLNISISFYSNMVSILRLYFKEIIVSGVPLVVDTFDMNPPRSAADILMSFLGPEHIILTDATQIHLVPSTVTGQRFIRGLYIYKDDEQWGIVGQTAVKLPGETDFTRYRSITFRPDWGEFIEGELFE